MDDEGARGQTRPREARVDDVFPAVALIAKMHDMARKTDLRALGVAEQRELGLDRAAVTGEAAGAEPQIVAVLHDEGPVRNGLADPRPGLGPQPVVVDALVVSAAVALLLGDRAPRLLRVLGSGRGAVHLDLDGFVLTLTGPGVPWMPNGIALPALPALPAVRWDRASPPLWDPVVAPREGGRAAVTDLARWLTARVAGPGVALEGAADRLVGRGPGLTPEGDDILGGAAIGLRALGPAAGLAPGRTAALIAALCPPDVRRRTGALSATLLELAVRGAAPEPVHRLLAAGDREAALADLRRLGASTGGAIAAGIALAAEYVVSATTEG